MRVMRTKLFLIFLIVIVLLNKRVCEKASISIRAFLLLLDIGTHLIMIKVAIPLSVLGIVVVGAVLMVMGFWNIARIHFECL